MIKSRFINREVMETSCRMANRPVPATMMVRWVECDIQSSWLGLDADGQFWMAYNYEKNGFEEPEFDNSEHLETENSIMVIFHEQVAQIQRDLDPKWTPHRSTYTCPVAEW